jgi:hypothetical protein
MGKISILPQNARIADSVTVLPGLLVSYFGLLSNAGLQ